jgi:hypothetical protein
LANAWNWRWNGYVLGEGAQVWRKHRFCSCGDGDDDPAAACVSGLAAPECYLLCGPWREAIDLSAYDAVQEFGCAGRQFERLEQKSLGLQYQLNVAAAQRHFEVC